MSRLPAEAVVRREPTLDVLVPLILLPLLVELIGVLP